MDVDVAVIGGGIAGLSAAAWLAPSCDVLVCEAEDSLGYHATGRSAAAYTECYGSDPIRRLAQASHDYLTTNDGLTSPLPVMFVAQRGDESRLNRLYESFRPLVPTLERLTPAEAVDRCNAFDSESIAGGVLEPGALNIDVHALLTMYSRRIKTAGQTVLTSAAATRIERIEDTGWSITAGAHTVTSRVLVNAAGAWADRIATMAGVPTLGLEPLLRSVFTFDPGRESSSWPLVVDADEQWYFKPEGPHVLGSGASEIPSEPVDARAPEIDVALGIEKITSATDLSIRSVRNTWAGLRTFTPDRVPVVGFDPAAPRFFWLAGQGGYGIKTSPVLGEAASTLILRDTIDDRITSFGITRGELAPDRFRH